MGMKKIILAGALGIAALSGTNVPGLEVTKASAASIESNFSTLEGRVVEVDNGVIVVKSKQYEEPVSVYIDSLSNVKVGDEVKATGSMMRNFTEYMVATAIENTTNKLGMHMKEDGSPDYVIGEVAKVGTMEDEGDGATKYVVVEYPSLNGKKVIIDVFLTKGQVFNTGKKVKIDMKYVGWGGSSINWNTTDHIEKVYDVKSNVENNDDVWIWS
ncbi:ATP F0F1 synthase subunit alpha [Bacillus anthracis]|uniref:ATP F0F1 synthase subunit alpha n=1 Tax=Bacillus tropicus TaxID=2026188 RepID=UPI000BF6FD5F|nr:ATP F0F1 synthase subunit alpha [Bacillus anthracis]PFD88223.1 ATP F0F1 synthase subunit alpha [Bacillus anthracis]PFR10678.1 ATP F0F1 synthase subunit alpha [Bacillus anthracis]PFT21323.1 ATP F0F1 synthase subunit alpha [Bacillus thuringiensis]PGZ34090.1 ATP F0F1 synthase subunit alpha [Bacillus anthracis]